MLDPVLLERFKALTREDEQIAQVICAALDLSEISSILDVGAGRGVISRAIAAKTRYFPVLEIVEPELAFDFPSMVKVYRDHWERLHLSRRFDLVVMSHVIGHFPPLNRGDTVARVLGALTSSGRAVIVENAPVEPFWSLNLEIGRNQSMQYVIDFDDLERALTRRGAEFVSNDYVIPLFLGRNESEQLAMLNVLFPEPFASADLQLVRQRWRELIPAEDGVLPLSQRFYYVQPSDHAAPD